MSFLGAPAIQWSSLHFDNFHERASASTVAATPPVTTGEHIKVLPGITVIHPGAEQSIAVNSDMITQARRDSLLHNASQRAQAPPPTLDDLTTRTINQLQFGLIHRLPVHELRIVIDGARQGYIRGALMVAEDAPALQQKLAERMTSRSVILRRQAMLERRQSLYCGVSAVPAVCIATGLLSLGVKYGGEAASIHAANSSAPTPSPSFSNSTLIDKTVQQRAIEIPNRAGQPSLNQMAISTKEFGAFTGSFLFALPAFFLPVVSGRLFLQVAIPSFLPHMH